MAQLSGLSVLHFNPFFADVNVAGVNKAMGINEFASYYGFDVSWEPSLLVMVGMIFP